MWKLKGCNRCGGDVFLDRDEYGCWYEECLQCGHRRELKSIVEPKKQTPVKDNKQPVLAARK